MIKNTVIAPFFLPALNKYHSFLAAPLSRSLITIILALLLMGGGETYPVTPEGVVYQYLRAMQEYDFSRAFQYLSDDMNNGKDAWNWSVEQKQIYEYAEVEIHSFEVFEATMKEGKAFVPNILKSRDNILNKDGIDEYELYVLRKINGDWVIDRQKLVFRNNRDEWFKKPYME